MRSLTKHWYLTSWNKKGIEKREGKRRLKFDYYMDWFLNYSVSN